ncbi:MAG: phosphonate metabolism transcriptional regulator PhnF [Candidatus Igneacidithiobacillus chanchocoensis]|jgi:GntR family phosphonate transport system transcriptional regulator
MASQLHTFQPGISIWRQIADDLFARIENKEWRSGERLPGEMLLADEYGVNRHTIRRALQHLCELGAAETRHGLGTFAAQPQFDYELVQRPRFSEWVKKYRKPGRNQILEARVLALQELPELARIQAYQVFPDHPKVAMVKTLGFVGEEPMSVARHLFFGERLLPLVEDLRAGRGITESLRLRGVQDYTRMRSTIQAALAQARERELLRLERGETLLVCENVNIDSQGRGIEFSTVLYPASRVRLVYEPG